MGVFFKDIAHRQILLALPFSAQGRPSVVNAVELVDIMLHKLRSGCQWRMLPVRQFSTGASKHAIRGPTSPATAVPPTGRPTTFFDAELYRRRAAVEHANAWLDGFKTLLVRYETSVGNWLAWHWLAFVVIFLRKIIQKPVF